MVSKKKPQKLILRNHQCPGDIVMLSYAIKALHEQYPGKYLTDVDTTCNDIFIGNPYITKLNPRESGVKILDMEYPTIHQSNQKPVQFVNGFIYDLSRKLDISLEPTDWAGAIWITDEEKNWYSAVHEITNNDPPYWCINAGHKLDFTAKAWDFDRYQAIVEYFPDLIFAQIGSAEHQHPKLRGKNVIDFVGKTDFRQLIRLIYNSFGVITGISVPMHLAYAIPAHPRFNRKSRACIVIAGGREPNHWEAAANHQFVHTCGMLDCCDLGGCWKSRVVPLEDNDEKNNSLCLYPVKTKSGQYIGKCFDLITVEEICILIKRYMDNLEYQYEK